MFHFICLQPMKGTLALILQKKILEDAISKNYSVLKFGEQSNQSDLPTPHPLHYIY